MKNYGNIGWVKKQPWTSLTLIAPVVVTVLWSGGIIGFAKPDPIVQEPAPLAVAVQEVQEAEYYEVQRSYLGTIESRRQSQLAFELAGKLNVVLVDEGDRVEPGQLLAQLDTAILNSQLSSLNAQIRAAQAQLDELIEGPRAEAISVAKSNVQHWSAQQQLASRTENRHLRLLQSKATSHQEYDDARFNAQAIDAQLAAAKSRTRRTAKWHSTGTNRSSTRALSTSDGRPGNHQDSVGKVKTGSPLSRQGFASTTGRRNRGIDGANHL